MKGKLLKGSVGKTIFKMAIPMAIAFIAMMSFNLIDTYFISKLGINELAAMSLTFPLVFFIQAIPIGLSTGLTAVLSRIIGSGKKNEAKRFTTSAMILGIIISIFVVLIGLLLIRPALYLVGADSSTIIFAMSYMTIWILGVIFVNIPMLGNGAIRATGNMVTPMLIMFSAIFVNLILDPILIFGFGPIPSMGIAGAAIATVIARFTTLILSASYLFHKGLIEFRWYKIERMIDYWRKVLFIGIPAMIVQVILPLSLGVLTFVISSFGNESLAAYGIGTRLENFLFIPIIALSTAIVPFVGQNMGSDAKSRVKKGIFWGAFFAVLWGILSAIIMILKADFFVSFFQGTDFVLNLSASYLKIVSLGFPLLSISLILGQVFNALHRPYSSTVVSISRLFIFVIPCAVIGQYLGAAIGLFIGISIGNALSGIIGIIWMKITLDRI